MSTIERKPTLDEQIAEAERRSGEQRPKKPTGNSGGPKPPVKELEK